VGGVVEVLYRAPIVHKIVYKMLKNPPAPLTQEQYQGTVPGTGLY